MQKPQSPAGWDDEECNKTVVKEHLLYQDTTNEAISWVIKKLVQKRLKCWSFYEIEIRQE